VTIKCSIIILAAGLSSRFGKNKLLEPMGNSPTLIEYVIGEALGSTASDVIVVCGYQFDKIAPVIERHNCKVVLNQKFLDGQSSSVKRGLEAVEPSTDAILVLPGDMALTKRKIIDAVILAYEKTHAPIVTAAYEGHPGHPILFDKSLFAEIMEIDEETRGLKKVVSQNISKAILVETSSGALFDLDRKEDLARYEKLRAENGSL
jgi:molybdenum cofactor cytidylyltransferase